MTANRPTVVFDGSILGTGTGPVTGVARAFLTTLAAYAQRHDAPALVVLLRDGAPTPPELDGADGIRFEPGAPRNAFERAVRLPARLRVLGADLLHSPITAVPPRAPCPMVATVHDLPWIAAPDADRSRADRTVRARLALRLAARRADTLVCVSRTTRHHLLRELSGRPRKARVRVVHNATPEADCDLATRPRPDAPLIAFTDARRTRKNGARIRRAHALARRLAGPAIPDLRFVGPPDHWLDGPAKDALLRDARALVHPVLADGFGLPVVEAFGCGLPVICSDRAGALPEIAPAGTALHVDPRDEESIAAAVVRICTDDELHQRLRERGVEESRRFRPARAAEGWARVHRECLS